MEKRSPQKRTGRPAPTPKRRAPLQTPAKSAKPKSLGLNIGPKTSSEMAAIGVKTLAMLRRLGWKKAFIKLTAKYPERINLNMATGLIGAELGCPWNKVPESLKNEARILVKAMKPRKPRHIRKSAPADQGFVDFMIEDQLRELNIRARRMFGGHGLYSGENFFGLIFHGVLYVKTSELSRKKYQDQGMQPFRPNPRMTLKNYYQVPEGVADDAQILQAWVQEALRI